MKGISRPRWESREARGREKWVRFELNNQENRKQVQQESYYREKAKSYFSCKPHYSNVQRM